MAADRSEYYRTYREAHRERYQSNARRAYFAEYSQRPEVLAARRLAEARRRAAKAASTVGLTSPEDVAQRMTVTWAGMCWICRSRPWEHIDHVKPLSRGGPHILANLRPACAMCNIHKRNTWPFTRHEAQIPTNKGSAR